MSSVERLLAVVGAIGLVLVLVELVRGGPFVLLWVGMILVPVGSIGSQLLFFVRHRARA